MTRTITIPTTRRHTQLSPIFHAYSDVVEDISARADRWFDEDNDDELRRFAADLEHDAAKLGSIARQLRALEP